MRIVRHFSETPRDLYGAVVALGNFDGVHRGHRAVIDAARSIARGLGAPVGVMSFEPHPRQVFRPDDPPFRLTLEEGKVRALAALGVDLLLLQRFDRVFSTIDAEAFADRVLVENVRARHLVCGHDFVFGRDRGGDVQLLERRAARAGIGLTAIAPVLDDAGKPFASTAVREKLRVGDPRGAALLLGRDWEISGIVEHGDRRGQTLGFPTANIRLGDYLHPKPGVYAVRAAGLPEDRSVHAGRPAVANFGRRPTVDGTDLLLETHIFDYTGDLYGRSLTIRFIEYLREERKFESLADLERQIGMDAAQAREILAGPAGDPLRLPVSRS